MNSRWWVGLAVLASSASAMAEGEPQMSASDARFLAALTLELSAGASDVFDTSSAPVPMAANGMPVTGIVHDHVFGPTLGLGLGGFVSDSVAVLARGTCAVQSGFCFLGPIAEYWLPGHRVWLSTGAGLGSDEACIGRQTSFGVDTKSCRRGSDGFDARVGVLLSDTARGIHGLSLAVEFVQVGTFTSDGSANALSLQLGYQWH